MTILSEASMGSEGGLQAPCHRISPRYSSLISSSCAPDAHFAQSCGKPPWRKAGQRRPPNMQASRASRQAKMVSLFLELEIHRPDDFRPARDLAGNHGGVAGRIGVERLGRFPLRQLPHGRRLENGARFLVEARHRGGGPALSGPPPAPAREKHLGG